MDDANLPNRFVFDLNDGSIKMLDKFYPYGYKLVMCLKATDANERIISNYINEAIPNDHELVLIMKFVKEYYEKMVDQLDFILCNKTTKSPKKEAF